MDKDKEIGKMLYKMVIEKAKANGYTTYMIDSPQTNPFPVTFVSILRLRNTGKMGPKVKRFLENYLGISIEQIIQLNPNHNENNTSANDN